MAVDFVQYIDLWHILFAKNLHTSVLLNTWIHQQTFVGYKNRARDTRHLAVSCLWSLYPVRNAPFCNLTKRLKMMIFQFLSWDYLSHGFAPLYCVLRLWILLDNNFGSFESATLYSGSRMVGCITRTWVAGCWHCWKRWKYIDETFAKSWSVFYSTWHLYIKAAATFQWPVQRQPWEKSRACLHTVVVVSLVSSRQILILVVIFVQCVVGGHWLQQEMVPVISW